MFAVIFNFILYISNKLFFRTSRSPDGLDSRFRRDRRGEGEENFATGAKLFCFWKI